MKSEYIKGLGVFVGEFSESDLDKGLDKQAAEKAMQETGLNYINSRFVKKNGKIVGMKVYVCTAGDFKI